MLSINSRNYTLRRGFLRKGLVSGLKEKALGVVSGVRRREWMVARQSSRSRGERKLEKAWGRLIYVLLLLTNTARSCFPSSACFQAISPLTFPCSPTLTLPVCSVLQSCAFLSLYALFWKGVGCLLPFLVMVTLICGSSSLASGAGRRQESKDCSQTSAKRLVSSI